MAADLGHDALAVPTRVGEHAGVLGPHHDDGVEHHDQLGMVDPLELDCERLGERLGFTRQLVDHAVRPLAGENGEAVDTVGQAVLAGEPAVRRSVVGFGEAERNFGWAAVRGPVDLTGAAATEVANHQLQRTANGEVGAVALTERIAA